MRPSAVTAVASVMVSAAPPAFSRESSFLFNNLILLASCFAVLWGTLFPVISEAVTGEKVSVDAPFYNRVNVPIGLFLLFLTVVFPVFPAVALLIWLRGGKGPILLRQERMTLDGKTGLVTGGSRGIGRALVRRLAGLGAAIGVS